MTKKYITNTGNIVDWDRIISDLDRYPGTVFGKDIIDYHYDHNKKILLESDKESLKYHYLKNPEGEINKAFVDDKESLEFFVWFPGKGYEKEIDTKIENLLGCKIATSWISKVNPGKCVAPHIDDEEIYDVQKLYEKQLLVRYHIHISKPSMGAAFFIEQDCYYYESQGSIFQWATADLLHCSMNAGIKPKFIYHAIGVLNSI